MRGQVRSGGGMLGTSALLLRGYSSGGLQSPFGQGQWSSFGSSQKRTWRPHEKSRSCKVEAIPQQEPWTSGV